MVLLARAITAAFAACLLAGCASTTPSEPPAKEQARGFKPARAPRITDPLQKEARDARLRAARPTAADAAKKAAAERPPARKADTESRPGGGGVARVFWLAQEMTSHRVGCARDTTERLQIDSNHRVHWQACYSDHDDTCSGPAEIVTFDAETLAKKRCEGGRSVDCRIVSEEADRLPRPMLDDFFSDCVEAPAPHAP